MVTPVARNGIATEKEHVLAWREQFASPLRQDSCRLSLTSMSGRRGDERDRVQRGLPEADGAEDVGTESRDGDGAGGGGGDSAAHPLRQGQAKGFLAST